MWVVGRTRNNKVVAEWAYSSVLVSLSTAGTEADQGRRSMGLCYRPLGVRPPGLR